MKKNGFTLIEIIAVIVIIGIIALITIPAVESLINNSKESLYNSQVKMIESAAKKWGLDNVNYLPDDKSNFSCINVDGLVAKGYLEGKVTNPINNEEMNGCVKITLTNFNQYKYEYTEDVCN